MKAPISKEGLRPLGILLLLSILTLTYSKILSLVFLTLSVFTVYFFRDPWRSIPDKKNIVVSPADGKITNIKTIDYHPFIEGSGTLVSIFLSPFDVHINRSPIDGEVKYTEYTSGSKLPAFLKRASKNERNTIGIEGEKIRVVVTQIAGTIGRRIVQWVDEMDTVRMGEKLGMIKFGSRTDIILPEKVHVNVRRGMKVKAGESIIGEYDA